MPIQMLTEVKSLVDKQLRELSTSLRHSKYAWIKANEEEAEAKQRKDHDFQSRVIGAVCDARMDMPPGPPLKVFGMEEIRFTLRSRLIVNQAGGVLENANLCLDPHYGCPYIPGSAVKGVARHAAWCAWCEEPDMEKKKTIAWRIVQVFGYPTGDRRPREKADDRDYLDNYINDLLGDRLPEKKMLAGNVVFFPAYPAARPKLVLDVATCHHRSYYSSPAKKVATEDEEPQPHFFPAVERGAEFVFCIAPGSRLRKEEGNTREEIMGFARQCLKRGLQDGGVGAKTAAGYGWFSESREGTAFASAEKAAVHQTLSADYSEKLFDNAVLKLLDRPGEWSKLQKEMEKLRKPQNAEWLKRFLDATAGKGYKTLREMPWYPKTSLN